MSNPQVETKIVSKYLRDISGKRSQIADRVEAQDAATRVLQLQLQRKETDKSNV